MSSPGSSTWPQTLASAGPPEVSAVVRTSTGRTSTAAHLRLHPTMRLVIVMVLIRQVRPEGGLAHQGPLAFGVAAGERGRRERHVAAPGGRPPAGEPRCPRRVLLPVPPQAGDEHVGGVVQVAAVYRGAVRQRCEVSDVRRQVEVVLRRVAAGERA